MKKFRFKLDALLRVRKLAEEARTRELHVRRTELATCDTELERIAGERALQVGELVRLNQGALDVPRLLAHRRWINALNRQALDASRERPLLEARVREAQAKLAQALTGRKTVERLRERREEEHRAEIAREERKELDELGRRTHENGAAFAGARGEAGA